MAKSAILSSSLAKKYWMALTGLFLCTFLIGHLLGNLQLVMKFGEEGKRAFNEYAYFMGHNIFIKVLSYVTYLSIVFHAIDGIMLAVQNKKARPQNYAYSNPGANSSSASRNMAVLGTLILIFICTHMANFWYSMKISGDPYPLHMVTKTLDFPAGQDPTTGQPIMQKINAEYVLMTNGTYKEYKFTDPVSGQSQEAIDIKEGTELYDKTSGLKVGEGYKDLHTAVMTFFGQKKEGATTNSMALVATILYVLSMAVLAFHLWHGFASAFQSLGIRHKRYTPIISIVGKAFSVLVPLLFAIIPVLIYIGYVN